MYDDTIYNFCARARFAGCSYLRHIILGLNTVRKLFSGFVLLSRAFKKIKVALWVRQHMSKCIFQNGREGKGAWANVR